MIQSEYQGLDLNVYFPATSQWKNGKQDCIIKFLNQLNPAHGFPDMTKISIIIPAYNEAKYIGANLAVLLNVRGIHELIVVDDGSSDDTSQIAKSFSGVKVIKHDTPRGKLQAISTGVDHASSENIAFYDADLIGMKAVYVEDMIETYQQGFDMVIMDKGSQPWIFRKLVKSLPAQSGTRIMAKSIFYAIDFGKKRSFDLEPKITRYVLQNNLRIGFVQAQDVQDPRKFSKYSFLLGLYLDIKAVWQIFTCDGLLGFPQVFSDMWTIEKMYRLGCDRPNQVKQTRFKRRRSAENY